MPTCLFRSISAGAPVAAMMVMAAACAQPGRSALLGVWGGDRLQLVWDDQGGRLTMDCASGTINTPVAVGAHGRFSAVGSMDWHKPGPQRADEEAQAPSKVLFSGQVTPTEMTLTLKPADGSAPQVFHLHKDKAVKLTRCL